MGASCVVATKENRRSDHDLELALKVGQRVINRRKELDGMTQGELAKRLGIDTRTYLPLEVGKSGRLKFGPDGVGQDSISRLEAGDLAWSGSGSFKRWVGPGMTLLARIEQILEMQPGALVRGIYIPEDTDDDTLAGRVRRDTSISEGKRTALLAILDGPEFGRGRLAALRGVLTGDFDDR